MSTRNRLSSCPTSVYLRYYYTFYHGNVDGMYLGAEAMIGIVRLAFPLDLGLGWYRRVGTVSRVCVILVFEYTVIKKSRQQESDAPE